MPPKRTASASCSRWSSPTTSLAAARRYIVDLAENVSPASIADTKRLVYEGYGVRYPDALDTIDSVQYAALDRVDAKEGAAALIEKRPPDFPRLADEGSTR